MNAWDIRNLIWDILDKIREKESIDGDMKILKQHDVYFYKYLWMLNEFASVETDSPSYGISVAIINYYLYVLCDDIYDDIFNPNKIMLSDMFYEWFDSIGVDKQAYADCMDVYLIDEIFEVIRSKTKEEAIKCYRQVRKIIERISKIKK